MGSDAPSRLPIQKLRRSPGIRAERIATFRRSLLAWFAVHRRDFAWRNPDASQYVRVVTEILLQRTQAESVDRMLPRFLASFPSWAALANCRQADLARHLRPLGLWRRRARTLRRLAKAVQNQKAPFPPSRKQLEALPGVGQYVASAILLFVHGRPEPLVDTNMARVLERYFGPRQLADIRFDPYLQALARQVVRGNAPERMNWAILDLGALVCLPRNPRCTQCPLKRGCLEHKRCARRSSESAVTIRVEGCNRHSPSASK